MAEKVADPKIGGGAAGLEPTVQQFAGWANGYGADVSDNAFPVRPRYNGPNFQIEGQRATNGKTLSLLAGGVNHLTLDTLTASSALNWQFDGQLLVAGRLTAQNDLLVEGNTQLGNSNTDSLIVKGISVFAEPVTLQKTLSVQGNTGLGATLTDRVDISGDADIGGSLVVHGTFTVANLSVTNLTVVGNTILGDTSGDSLLTHATSIFQANLTIQNPGGSPVPFFADVANGRVIVGSVTALPSASNDRLDVVGGRLYVAPSGEVRAIGLRHSVGATASVFLGASADTAPDFLVDNGTTTLLRGVNAGGLIVGSVTTFVGAEKLRVVGGGYFSDDVTIDGGDLIVSDDALIDGDVTLNGNLNATNDVVLGGAGANLGFFAGGGDTVQTVGGDLTAGADLTDVKDVLKTLLVALASYNQIIDTTAT